MRNQVFSWILLIIVFTGLSFSVPCEPAIYPSRGARLAEVEKVLDKASHVAGQITKNREKSWVLQNIAELQGRVGDLAGTQKTVNRLGSNEEGPALTAIALASAWAGDGPGAVRLANEIPDRYERNLALYSIALVKASKRNRVRAQETAAVIDNPVVRDAAFRAIRRRNTPGEKLGIPPATRIVWRTTNAVRDLAVMSALAGNVEVAVETAERAMGIWKQCALITIAEIQARSKDVADAMRIAGRIPEPHESGGRSYRMIAWFRIAIAQAETGNVEGALGTATRLNDFLRSHALQAISAAIAKGGGVEGAVALARSDESHHAQARTLLGVAEGILEGLGIAVKRASAGEPCWPITLH